MPALPASDIERVFREEYGRAVAVLVRVFGDIDVAEEAVQDAFTAAVQRGVRRTAPEPGGMDHHHRPQPGDRPLPPGGVPRGPARPGSPAAGRRRTGRTGRGGRRARRPVEGPDAALTLVDGLDLGGYHLFHAIRADLLRRLGRNAEAALAYEAAIARTENATERDFLQRSRQALTRA